MGRRVALALPAGASVSCGARPRSQAETQAGRASVDGDPQALGAWVALMDKFEPNFGIVTP
ncbi:alkyl sulfatase C-terminal domain-containing protein [Cupriavidus necator]